MDNKRIHRHTIIHNNSFEPDSAIFAEVKDSEWRKSFDLEILVTRHLGEDRFLSIVNST